MITGYGHFVTLAESLQWDEKTLDVSPDIAAWPQLTEAENRTVLGLVAGFCIAEAAVAEHLTNFQAAASEDDSMQACFTAQARDEARHARFFDRIADEVIGVPGDTMLERMDALRERAKPEIVELFEERLPSTAARLADDHTSLTGAVGLYHMILEGVVLLAGQHGLIDALDRLSVKMPGLHKGMELVVRDERWHIGFGSRVIQSADLVDDEVSQLLKEGEEAAMAWGDLITDSAIEEAAQLHRRRLRSVGIKFW